MNAMDYLFGMENDCFNLGTGCEVQVFKAMILDLDLFQVRLWHADGVKLYEVKFESILCPDLQFFTFFFWDLEWEIFVISVQR